MVAWDGKVQFLELCCKGVLYRVFIILEFEFKLTKNMFNSISFRVNEIVTTQ